jgi:hypothetical protein
VSPAAQIALPVEAKVPVDPAALVDLAPIERGRLHAAADLDCWQIACVEEALRMVKAGTYPQGPR